MQEFSFYKNEFENVFCKKAAILLRPQYVSLIAEAINQGPERVPNWHFTNF